MIDIRGLQKTYPNFTLNCTMQVQKGRITGLVGQNGAGKSTLFKACLGLISFDGGTVTVLGKAVQELTATERQALGVVLSDSGLSGYLTVRDIIPVLKGMYPAFAPRRFEAQVRRFGLPMEKQIKDFSTGMKAKLKVLVALSHEARLLILDEPTSGLDVVARDELLLVLREYMEEQPDRAMLISSHIASDLETLCDDLYMIHDGRIILHEDTDVLLGEYALLKVDEEQFAQLDRRYLLYVKKEPYGYSCLTDQKRFYLDNHPQIVVENGSLDHIVIMMMKGEKQ